MFEKNPKLADDQQTGDMKPRNDQTSTRKAERTRNNEKRSLLGNLFSFRRARAPTTLREDLTDALADGQTGDTLFSPEERTMLNNILRLREARVDDVMIPRSEIKALDLKASLAEALDLFESSGHSRMPVYAETLDDPRGMLHIRDVLNYFTRRAHEVGKQDVLNLAAIDLNEQIGKLGLIRTVLFVPGSMLASQLLSRMQATHTQMALVIDEYGGTDGLVSMEDIVELVVGDIEDEHDDDDVTILKEDDDCWVIDARAELEDVQEALGADFRVNDYDEDVDTIGGLIVCVLDRIPIRGEIIHALNGFEIKILDADKRRVKRVRASRIRQVNQSKTSHLNKHN